MTDPIHVVTGATGHVGSGICSALLAGRQRVRGVARGPRGLRELAERGGQPAMGSLEDPAFLRATLTGASTLFAMIPPNLTTDDYRGYTQRVLDAYAEALPGSGVRHVVTLSSIGAQVEAGTGPIVALRELEKLMDGLPGISVVHLRAAYFFENLLEMIPLIEEQGLMGSPLSAELDIPMIATRDIAAVAAARLQARDFMGSTKRELHGAREHNMNDVARVLGTAIGNPQLPYVRFAYDGARAAMVAAGMSEEVADLYIEMDKALNDGLIIPVQPRTVESTTPTTLEDFAQAFAAAYLARQAPMAH